MEKETAQFCKVKKDGNRFLVACMPNGDIIPGQIDLKIESPIGYKGMALITFSFQIPLDDFIIQLNSEE